MTQHDAAAPIVEVEALTKHFPASRGARVHAVEQVSLHIDRGETLAVVGESGCGKSTLAYLIIRLLNPTSGIIRLDRQKSNSPNGKPRTRLARPSPT